MTKPEAIAEIKRLMVEHNIPSVEESLRAMLTDDIGLFHDGEQFVLSDVSCDELIDWNESLVALINGRNKTPT